MPGLPTSLSKSYSTRANIPFTTGATAGAVVKNMLWTLKAALKNELSTGTQSGTRHANSVWTVVGSSDGVTAALDGVDRWGSTFDAAKIVNASNTTVHSWIILQNSTLGQLLLIDCNSTTVSSGRVVITNISSPFTLNGTNSRYSPNPPSPTNRAVVYGTTADDVTYTSIQLFYYNSDVSAAYYKFYGHMTMTDDGQFFWLYNRVGDGVMAGGVAMVRATDASASDMYQYYLVGGAASFAPPFPSSSAIGSSFVTGRSPDGSSSDGGMNIWNFGGTSSYSITTFSDFFTAKVNFYTAHMWSTVRFAYRGYIADVYVMIGGRAGAVVPSAASPRWISLNRMLWPWVGIAPYL